MRDVMFEAPDMSSKKNKCIMVTKEMVEQYARNTITCGKYKKV